MSLTSHEENWDECEQCFKQTYQAKKSCNILFGSFDNFVKRWVPSMVYFVFCVCILLVKRDSFSKNHSIQWNSPFVNHIPGVVHKRLVPYCNLVFIDYFSKFILPEDVIRGNKIFF